MENNEDILKKINSGEPEVIAEAVNAIKENGDLNIATILLNHLGQIQDPATTTIITNLLADIKDNQFKELLVEKLETTNEEATKTELLRIVWESSLDYSAYLDHFLKILQNAPFTVAFEASTAIENMVYNLTADQRTKLIQVLDTFPEDKKFLTENIREELNVQE